MELNSNVSDDHFLQSDSDEDSLNTFVFCFFPFLNTSTNG